MSEAPERIWAWTDKEYDATLWNSHGDRRYTPESAVEYIRANLPPKVKPLVWRNSYGVLRAETAFGDYIVTGNILRIGPMSCEMVSEDPKAAAQADYERRILSALEE